MNRKKINFLYNEVVVPIPCQFNKDLSINYNLIGKHIQFLLKKKVKVFYLAQSASELEWMNVHERIKLAKFVSKKIKKRAVLLLQPLAFTNVIDQIEEGKKLISLGCDALVIQPVPVKDKQDFYSHPFELSNYSSFRHDKYYFDYMQKVSKALDIPIIFNNKGVQAGKPLSNNVLDKILNLKNVVSLKEHNRSLNVRNRLYKRYGLGKKIVCYDGYGKYEFLLSWKSGARCKHSNFSWFDPEWDRLFMKLLSEKKFKLSKKMVKAEADLKKAIILTGYSGYKELMRFSGVTNSKGYVRMPGCNLNKNQEKIVHSAFSKFKKKRENFLKSNKF